MLPQIVIVALAALAQPDCLGLVAKVSPAPPGYRYPEPDELRGSSWAIAPDEYGLDVRCVSADLNGDRRPDYATFLLSVTDPSFRVVLVISRSTGGYESIPVFKSPSQGFAAESASLTLRDAGPVVEEFGCSPHPPVQTGITLPRVGVELLSYGGRGSKPEHWLFFWRGRKLVQEDRCDSRAWALVSRENRF